MTTFIFFHHYRPESMTNSYFISRDEAALADFLRVVPAPDWEVNRWSRHSYPSDSHGGRFQYLTQHEPDIKARFEAGHLNFYLTDRPRG
jgi:hypothetical protein